mmetsp:Transcript_25878/g.102058  ORF Transcript_25878/g.102058 Transcript_25878/m.102058 type:complete len:86 (-) Transcript_25878:47-304(-)
MVLLDLSMRAGAVWSFQAEVVILYHGTTIKEGYQPIVHCVTVRQAAKVCQANQLALEETSYCLALTLSLCFRLGLGNGDRSYQDG